MVAAVGFRALVVTCFKGGDFMSGYSIKAIILFVYIILPTVSTIVCSVFSCDDFDGGDGDDLIIVMTADASVDCTSDKYRHFIYPLAWAMVFVWPVGVPLATYALLWAHRERIETRKTRSGDSSLGAIAFMYRVFLPTHWCVCSSTSVRLCMAFLLQPT